MYDEVMSKESVLEVSQRTKRKVDFIIGTSLFCVFCINITFGVLTYIS